MVVVSDVEIGFVVIASAVIVVASHRRVHNLLVSLSATPLRRVRCRPNLTHLMVILMLIIMVLQNHIQPNPPLILTLRAT